MADENSKPQILPEVQVDVSKFFDTKISIFESQEKRLEKLLKIVRAYSDSYKLSKERALSALFVEVPDVVDQKHTPLPLTTENAFNEKVNSGNVAESILHKVERKHTISELDEEESIVTPSSDLVYDKRWNHSLKVQFVIMEPQKYGLKTFDGSNSVVDAILTHEPEWAKRETRAAILAKIAPTISKLVKRRRLFKLRVKGSKADFNYVSGRWFDLNGIIKPEYKRAIEHLQTVGSEKTLAPVRAGANSEVDERNGGHPSTNAAGTLNGSISLNEHPNPTIFK